MIHMKKDSLYSEFATLIAKSELRFQEQVLNLNFMRVLNFLSALSNDLQIWASTMYNRALLKRIKLKQSRYRP